MRFTAKTEHVLLKSGWIEGRRADWRPEAERCLPGVSLPAPVSLALDEFTGLDLFGVSYFDVGIETARFIVGHLDGIERITGIRMYPIGFTNDGGSTFVLMDGEGRVFWAFEHVEFIGANIEQALEFLLSREEAQPVPEAPAALLPGAWRVPSLKM